ncbi:MAG: hypothetical protein H6531_05860 [Actinobacteria bacterium]|nr:hypothetical protein [Actinomycetota bacterium]
MARTDSRHIAQIFGSALQADILARLLLTDDASITAAELVDSVDESRATVFRELRRLTQVGILRREEIDGNACYRAATDSPLYPALRELAMRTVGVEAMLREGLGRLDGVDAAAIFGDWAKGVIGGPSPIHVLVVGSPDQAALTALARRVSRRAGRTINPVTWTREELDQELAWPTGFVAELTREALVPLVGAVHRDLPSTGVTLVSSPR